MHHTTLLPIYCFTFRKHHPKSSRRCEVRQPVSTKETRHLTTASSGVSPTAGDCFGADRMEKQRPPDALCNDGAPIVTAIPATGYQQLTAWCTDAAFSVPATCIPVRNVTSPLPTHFGATSIFIGCSATWCRWGKQRSGLLPYSDISSATSAVQPVWWAAPRPRPLSPLKYS